MGSILFAHTPTVLPSPPIFRREHQFLYECVVITFGPAVISLRFQEQQLFRGQRGLLARFIYVGPIHVQLIASVLGREHLPV